MSAAMKQKIKDMSASIMHDALHQPANTTTAKQQLADMLTTANPVQRSVYNHILKSNQHMHVVWDNAGTGKCYLLHMLKYKITAIGLNPVELATTGVFAYTTGGQTIDRFLGLTMGQPRQYNPIRIDDYL